MVDTKKEKSVNIIECPFFTEYDAYLFKEGNHFRTYEKLGAHLCTIDGVQGVSFSLWVPNAERVSVLGDFNDWNPQAHPLRLRQDGTGIWEGFIAGLKKGVLYKYHIVSKYNNYTVDKADPYAFYCETPPKTASVVWDLDYTWKDKKWMKRRHQHNALNAPISIYEVHLGSWKRVPEEDNRFLSYREIAHQLAEYVKDMGFTHVEFLPVMEHPFYGSWGYQVLGFFAPTSRYGTPQDFMYLVDYLHQQGIGVILDWVPSHFPSDEHGLVYFDGTHLYEHADMRRGFHPEWQSYIFNYGRNEVRNFLISSALFWFDKYHIDALRVDAVASLLYLDYARSYSDWAPNVDGGKENIEAINFLRRLNEVVYKEFPGVQMIAEESTAWPMVSRPLSGGGLGFGFKWNMGWMHDTLFYISKDPINRKHHHDQLTFSMWYAYYENFILPLSHDEVVYGKCSLLEKMPGDAWQKFANLRLLLGYMYMHVGKKLLFMGAEFAQTKEWVHELSLDWHLLQYPFHRQVQDWLKALNRFYVKEPALYELDYDPLGFQWVDFSDWQSSIISFLRKAKSEDVLLVVCNFTPVPRNNYRIGVPAEGMWEEILNSDAAVYGGSGYLTIKTAQAIKSPLHNQPSCLSLNLPPLGIIVLKKKQSQTSS